MENEVRSLTALRGIAALWVVAFHYSHHVAWVPAKIVVKQGGLAVDLFFTLSGFILFYVYRNGFDTTDFLIKRFARLYPVHLVTFLAMIGMILAARAAGVSANGSLDANDLLAHLFALHSTGINDSLALNYPSWSISAEFFAYLTFPMLLPLIVRCDLRIAIPAAIVFFAACFLVAGYTGRTLSLRTYDFAMLRIMPEFIFGMIAARMCLEGKVSPRICALIAVALLVIGIGTEERVLSIMAAPFLIAALFFAKFHVPAWLRYLGVISYSLYMVHAPVEKVSFTVMEAFFDAGKLPTWTMFVAMCLAVLAGAAMYHLVEVPGRRMVMSLANRRMMARPS